MNSDSRYGSEETDTTSCMCGTRTGLVGAFAVTWILHQLKERARGLAIEPRRVRTHMALSASCARERTVLICVCTRLMLCLKITGELGSSGCAGGNGVGAKDDMRGGEIKLRLCCVFESIGGAGQAIVGNDTVLYKMHHSINQFPR